MKERKLLRNAAKPPQRSEVVIAIGWYSLRDWQLLKRVAADSESLHATYREWVDEVERTIAAFRDAGTTVGKLEVDVEELQQWCRERSLENTAANRATFIAEKNRVRGTRF